MSVIKPQSRLSRPAEGQLSRPAGLVVRLDTTLELLEPTFADGRPKVLATVVTVAGSTYRKPGARMMIMADGELVGVLTGGCLEEDLKFHAQQVFASGKPRAIEYDMRGPDDLIYGIGAGCEGAMRVLLEPADCGSLAAAALAEAGDATRAGRSTSLVVVHESAELKLGTYRAAPSLSRMLVAAAEQALANCVSRDIDSEDSGQRTRALVQFLAPPPNLLVCGAGPDAEPVVSTARALGWHVVVVDHRPAYVIASRFPGAEVRLADVGALRASVEIERCHAAVVMSHHLESDASYLRELGEAGAPAYVGLLGPAARRSRLAQELGATADMLRSRIRGPVGLDIGATTPEGIALAIVGEIHAWLAGRAARGLAFDSPRSAW
jgi:xanthine dehydrogenase accessory factor